MSPSPLMMALAGLMWIDGAVILLFFPLCLFNSGLSFDNWCLIHFLGLMKLQIRMRWLLFSKYFKDLAFEFLIVFLGYCTMFHLLHEGMGCMWSSMVVWRDFRAKSMSWPSLWGECYLLLSFWFFWVVFSETLNSLGLIIGSTLMLILVSLLHNFDACWCICGKDSWLHFFFWCVVLLYVQQWTAF